MAKSWEWAADLLLGRVSDAVDSVSETYGGGQRLAIHGRALLLDDVPRSLSVRDYPADTSDDWRADADTAYEAARACWFAGGNGDEVQDSARFAVADEQARRRSRAEATELLVSDVVMATTIRAGRFWARITSDGYELHDDTRGLIRTVYCGGTATARKSAASGEVAQLYYELQKEIRESIGGKEASHG